MNAMVASADHRPEYIHFNAPVGYSKNPLDQPRVSVPRTVVEPEIRMENIDQLPLEVRAQIAAQLNQYDCLSLALTSRAFASSSLPRLYSRIVVDSCYTEFSKEYDDSCTYLNLLYNFKKLVRSFTGQQAVHCLQVVSLPDLTNIYDVDVNEQLVRFFGRLRNLRELVWLLDNFRLGFLRELPDPILITRLELNVKFSNYLGELSVEDRQCSFPNLVSFHIRPFHNLRRLVKMINNLLVANNGAHVRSNLRSLKLAQFDKDTAVLVPPARDLGSSNLSEVETHEFELDTLEAVFLRSNIGRLDGLTELAFNNVLVSDRDGTLLVESVNLPNLKRLELKNVSEHGAAECGFLGRISPYLGGLRHLHLDFREALRDSVGDFLAKVELEELDLVVRINDTKRARVDLEQMYVAYALAILNQPLRKLSIEVREENSFCDVVRPTPMALFHGLDRLKDLESLRLNAGDSAHGVEALLLLLAALKKLKMLDVFGQKAGGAPHLGLGMSHPNIYDEWFKVQHVALLYWRAQVNLQYVRINKCIFEYCGGMPNPRDVIDRWFDAAVRVGWD